MARKRKSFCVVRVNRSGHLFFDITWDRRWWEGTTWTDTETNRKRAEKWAERIDKAIRDGFAWLVHNWKTDMNPGAPKGKDDSWRYYYYYAVERAGVLALVHNIGGHNWHTEIGKIILKEQKDDGSWPGAKAVAPEGIRPFEHGPLWNTCFAVLFLKKATAPILKPETIFTGEGFIKKDAPREKKDK